ncbi:MAG: bifunctional DNA-formamidopyrimidine glycosylase/DNA-(apurinic or apyrimidinic site) lyase [Alphaproteobacteria bacterium]
MPELPEVETVSRGLATRLEGQRIVHVDVRRPDLRFPFTEGFADKLTGRRIESFGRRGKYMAWALDDGAVVLGHLGMSGRFTLYDPGTAPDPGKHDHLVLQADNGVVAHYHDPRRFGFLFWLPDRDAFEAHPMIAPMGPEPLSNAFNADTLSAGLKGRKSSIKAALLDQKLVAGLGNIYVAEALYHAKISPRRIAHTVAGKRAERLAPAIVQVLRKAIESGGSSLRDFRQSDGELGYFQHNWAVYGREGEACPDCDCDIAKTGGIKRIVQQNRSTFFCSRRQR